MSLELRKGTRKFYARITVKGKRELFALETRYEGEPPPRLRIKLKGDAAFEKSRLDAVLEERELKVRLQKPANKVATLERIHHVQTGEKIEALPLTDLLPILKKKVRKRKLSDKHLHGVSLAANRFIEYLSEQTPRVEHADSVNREMAEGFLRSELVLS